MERPEKQEPLWVKFLVLVMMAIVLLVIKNAFDRMDAEDDEPRTQTVLELFVPNGQ